MRGPGLVCLFNFFLFHLPFSAGDGIAEVQFSQEKIRTVGQTSTSGTFVSLTLCFFGLGLLTMPYGMQYVGMIGGPIIIMIVCLVTYYSFYALNSTKRFLVSKGREVNSYGDIGRESMGKTGATLVNIAIIANQTGVLAAYQQFIAKNILHFTSKQVLPLSAWTLLCLVVLIPLCWVRQLKYFAFTSVLGLTTVAFTVIAVIYNGIVYQTPPDPIPIGPSDLFLFLGIGAFAYAAIAVSFNLETQVRILSCKCSHTNSPIRSTTDERTHQVSQLHHCHIHNYFGCVHWIWIGCLLSVR